jgi:hypothetical protein
VRSYRPRRYHVVKVCLPYGITSYIVVSEDMDDPDVWVVIDRFTEAKDAWRYVRATEERNRALALEAGCAA